MYSTKESIVKNHYTVTLSMSPIPNGGFMFEVHQDDILVIEGAKFNDNLNYLLSMGTKSMTEILNQDSNDVKGLDEFDVVLDEDKYAFLIIEKQWKLKQVGLDIYILALDLKVV
jgi:hypothetical protein